MATEKQRVTMADFEAAMFEMDGASEYKKILVYGGSGTGKTVLAGSLPGNTLFLAGEPGYISAARQGARGTVRIVPDAATALAAADWLDSGGASKFDWVVVDGLSTMNNKFLLGYAAEAFDANPAKRAHRNLPDKPDYFNAQNFTKSWVARMIDVPCNVLFTAHAMYPEDKATGEQLVYPAIQGKGYEVSSYVCGLMHSVGYMSQRVKKTSEGAQQVRRILWQHYRDSETETTYFAKDQFDALGRFTDDLPMTEIIKLMDDRDPNTAPGDKVIIEPEAPTKTATRRRAPARR